MSLKKKYIFSYSILICFGIILLSLTYPRRVVAAASATIISQNLMSGISQSSITSFVYNLSSLPVGTGATIQFSTDGTNWYNKDKAAGSETLTTGVNNTITITNYSDATFYYKLSLTGNGTNTPVLDDITVNYSITANAYTSGSTATYTVQSTLTDNTTYYTRAYATDPGGSLLWSGVSTTVSFTTGTFAAPTNCQVSVASNISPAVITWTDNSNIENNYLLETSVNGGAFALAATLAANTITSTQTMSSGTYQYRVRAVSSGQYSTYCTTSTVTYYGVGNIRMEKVGLEKIQIQ